MSTQAVRSVADVAVFWVSCAALQPAHLGPLVLKLYEARTHSTGSCTPYLVSGFAVIDCRESSLNVAVCATRGHGHAVVVGGWSVVPSVSGPVNRMLECDVCLALTGLGTKRGKGHRFKQCTTEAPADQLCSLPASPRPIIVRVGQPNEKMRAKSILSLTTLPFRNGYAFAVLVAIVFMQAGFHSGRRDKRELLLVTPEIQEALKQPLQALGGARGRGVVEEHPIPKLMEQAEERYRKKLARQSKTFKSAVAEYKRKYRRPPPKGFYEWWTFAQKHQVKMVDEYDGLMSDLDPFWGLSGAELRRRAKQAAEFPSVDLVRVRDGKAESVNLNGQGVSGRAEGFRLMLERFQSKLPSLDFPINVKSENRVLVPWEHITYPNMTVQDSSKGLSSVLHEPFRPDWAGQGTTWDKWRRTCHPDSAARRIFSSLRSAFRLQNVNYFESDGSPGDDFAFTPTPASDLNFCDHPEAHTEQGHFYTDFRPIPVLYPIFSPAKAQGFLDIRIPSHYYFGNTPRYTYGYDSVNLEMRGIDSAEVPWEQKEDKVFWRGASTGGGNHPQGFASHFHRHRFLQMTSDTSDRINRTVTFADPPDSSHYVAASVPVAKLNEEVMDTAFTKAVSADSYPGGESELKSLHRFADAVPLGRHWAYKYRALVLFHTAPFILAPASRGTP
ncbi:hypothetical protein D9611_012097 [Ephemerocybe angulata]|uniref:Glycosyl transferase CAP10 domain-containing protein n=2 Tax=Ephemerocybe angulata TaxID=980116 RepID=A0A8H5ES62_9AGAR|nr:hypothetical protein D9611_012097 [Tulosesus angulatus]